MRPFFENLAQSPVYTQHINLALYCTRILDRRNIYEIQRYIVLWKLLVKTDKGYLVATKPLLDSLFYVQKFLIHEYFPFFYT